jgi:phosphocarrier protein FPr
VIAKIYLDRTRLAADIATNAREGNANPALALWQFQNGSESGIHIMFPMISRISEWRKAREIAEQVRNEVGAPKLPLGIMVEVPSTALLAEHFAKEVDFFSIGSNDLTQYTLAMDRLHPDLAGEADSFSPALLKLISMTVQAADANGKWVGVCGNMAADPDLACILLGLGVKEISVSPANIPALKLLIRSVSYKKLRDKARKALTLESSAELRKLYKNRADLT